MKDDTKKMAEFIGRKGFFSFDEFREHFSLTFARTVAILGKLCDAGMLSALRNMYFGYIGDSTEKTAQALDLSWQTEYEKKSEEMSDRLMQSHVKCLYRHRSLIDTLSEIEELQDDDDDEDDDGDDDSPAARAALFEDDLAGEDFSWLLSDDEPEDEEEEEDEEEGLFFLRGLQHFQTAQTSQKTDAACNGGKAEGGSRAEGAGKCSRCATVGQVINGVRGLICVLQAIAARARADHLH